MKIALLIILIVGGMIGYLFLLYKYFFPDETFSSRERDNLENEIRKLSMKNKEMELKAVTIWDKFYKRLVITDDTNTVLLNIRGEFHFPYNNKKCIVIVDSVNSRLKIFALKKEPVFDIENKSIKFYYETNC